MIDIPRNENELPPALSKRWSPTQSPNLIDDLLGSAAPKTGEVNQPTSEQLPVPNKEPAPALWTQWVLTRRDQLVVATGLVVILLLTTAHWIRLSDWGRQTVEINRHVARTYDYRVDVNASTWIEWDQLPGLGETLSRRIVADVKANGPFQSIDDLTRVNGIGPKTLEKIRPWLVLNEPERERLPADE